MNISQGKYMVPVFLIFVKLSFVIPYSTKYSFPGLLPTANQLLRYNGTFNSILPFRVPPETIGNTEELLALDNQYSKCQGIDIREISISSLQELFSSNRLTSRELTMCYIQRIRALNPYLRAVLEVNPDALKIATALDIERKFHVRGPLHGIPILVKDNFATLDRMETAAGALALVGVKPVRDSEVVRKLRESGAVILGKSNLAEFSFFRGSNVPNGWSGRGGHVTNAYNLDVNPEGSSTGSAVSTAVNLASAAIGTETDGSLISPSSVASCVSVKSTLGLVPTQGVIPVSHNQDVPGPITRTISDAAFLLDSMVTRHGNEVHDCGGTYGSCLQKPYDKPFQVGIPRRPFWAPEITNSTFLAYEVPILNELLETIKTHNLVNITDPVEAEWDHLRTVAEVEVIVVAFDFKYGINRYLQEETVQVPRPGHTRPIRNLQDIIDFNKEYPETELGYNQDLLELAQASDGLHNVTYRRALESNREVTQNYLNTLFDEQGMDIIAVPSEPRYVDLANPNVRHSPFVGWTMAAIAGYPSITVPVGYDQDDVPFGICFIGRPYSELQLLRIAKIVEDLWPARRPPRFLKR